ncbi:MAG: PSD1 and planctomycete cytochrome C domain-containing protein, partial [Actinomycetota bacterium]
AGALLAGAASSAPPPGKAPTAEEARFFETNVRPVLFEQCSKCHGPVQQSGNFRTDSLAAMLKGGVRGAGIVPGHPEKSLLLKAILHQEGAPKMPPGKKLTDRQLADLARWIKMGAPWPSSAAPAAGARNTAQHWSFQPVAKVTPPKVKDAAWVKTPVDAFILAGLEAKGLRPNPPADKRTLIRRATFDLTGLPPTPAEVDAFINDLSPNAFAKVVDRLLASPAYGERWGRHWLDLARYADSNGLDENVHYGNAWRYRDWVVSAFNRDEPYNQFLVKQVAGDLLPPTEDVKERNDRFLATGFLAVGPKFISEVDTEKVLIDIVDEQLDTLGRTTMGLTLGCARCHDHKFDPISNKDYYALAGIFKSTKVLDILKKPRMWHENPLVIPEEQAVIDAHQKKVTAHQKLVDGLLAEAKTLFQAANPGKPLPKNVETALPAPRLAELQKLRNELTQLAKNAPEPPRAMGLAEGAVVDLPIHIRGSHLELGEKVPRRFPLILASAAKATFTPKQSGRLQLAEWLTSPDHPLTGRVIVNRVWRWHFGRGIVGTPDNFGLLGEDPSHPELLDWLATAFVSTPQSIHGSTNPASNRPSIDPLSPSPIDPNGCGWSFKAMHRLLMLSNTYQMASAPNERAMKVDPENRLWWRADLRRLEVEEMRDSLLAVSGLLDRKIGGRALQLKNREYVFDHTSKDATKYDSRRRTLYVPVVRNNLYDVFQLFDFGDASIPEGNRPATTVAPQALFMMNSDLVIDAAEALAAKTLERSDLDTPRRINLLYQEAYGRVPTPTEREKGVQVLAGFEKAANEPDAAKRQSKAWSWYCHVLLAANEFVYLR